MIQEEKELLLKDLSGRLPYGVKCQIDYGDADVYVDTLATITIDGCACFLETIDTEDVLEYGDIKPYLFPSSSMTEEQMIEYKSLCNKVTSECGDIYGTRFVKDYYYDTVESIDYLYKNHIDIRGIIPKGLAIDATGKNIY